MVESETAAIGVLLTESVIATLQKFGEEWDLPGLAWRVVHYPEGLVIEGSPRTKSDAPSCGRWAERLGMASYGFESSLGTRTWYLNDDVWAIEIRDTVSP